MKAILNVNINDWSNPGLPEIKKGTVIQVRRLQDEHREVLAANHMGSVIVNNEVINFTVYSDEFNSIN